MSNHPIYGCQGCNTTAGRAGCMFHRDPVMAPITIPLPDQDLGDRIAALEAALAEANKKYEDEREDCGIFQRKCIALEQALAERTRELDFSNTELADTRKRLTEMEQVWERDGRAHDKERTADRAAIRALYAATPEKDNGYFRCRLCRQHGAHRLGDITHESWCPVVRYAAAIQRAQEQ